MAPLRIVGIGGSLDASSSSRSALRIALDSTGCDTTLFDVRELGLPLYVHGGEIPESARRFVDAVASADGLVWCSPLYHGSVSGAFKNAIDWLELLHDRQPPYLTDKIVGLICTAGGGHGLQAINAMEHMVRALRGMTLPLVVPIERAHLQFDDDGSVRDAKVADQLQRLGSELARVIARMHPR